MSESLRTIVVTGANRGLGREIVRGLALLGCRVLLTARAWIAVAAIQHGLG